MVEVWQADRTEVLAGAEMEVEGVVVVVLRFDSRHSALLDDQSPRVRRRRLT